MTTVSRRRLLTGAAALGTLAVSRSAAACEPDGGLVVEERTFHVEDLDPAHDGLRVAQLSDIHVGATTPDHLVREAIRQVNRAQPDLVVLTGDYLVMAKTGVGLMKELLGGLLAPTVAILGNHDYWVDPAGAQAALEGHGYAVLRNQSTSIRLKNEAFGLIGVDDLWTRHHDVPKAFAGAPKGSRLVLAHVPKTIEELSAREEPMLVLSGHTHGGQIALPLVTPALNRVFNRDGYVRGTYRVGKAQLYVNRGVGTSGMPLRVGSAPEVTVATLRRAQSPGISRETSAAAGS